MNLEPPSTDSRGVMRRKRRRQILDELLVLRGQGGDPEALRGLVEVMQPRLMAHAWHLTGDAEAAADAVQEAWVAIVKGLRRLQDPARFRSWALKIVTFKCRDWIRRAQSGRRLAEGLAQEQALREGAPPAPTEEVDSVLSMREAIAALQPDRKALLSMFYLEEMSVRDIATALSIPAGTVKSRLFHAREKLRTLLEE